MVSRKTTHLRQSSWKNVSQNLSRARYIGVFKMRTTAAASSVPQRQGAVSGVVGAGGIVGAGGAGIPAGADIEELAFVVLMERRTIRTMI
jgi:hypothetical protein